MNGSCWLSIEFSLLSWETWTKTKQSINLVCKEKFLHASQPYLNPLVLSPESWRIALGQFSENLILFFESMWEYSSGALLSSLLFDSHNIIICLHNEKLPKCGNVEFLFIRHQTACRTWKCSLSTIWELPLNRTDNEKMMITVLEACKQIKILFAFLVCTKFKATFASQKWIARKAQTLFCRLVFCSASFH